MTDDIYVAHLPSYPSRYQERLIDSLKSHDISCTLSDGLSPSQIYRLIFAEERAVLHIHFIYHFIPFVNSTRSIINNEKFFAKIYALRASGVPIVWTVHDLHHPEGPFGPDEWRSRRRFTQLCDAIITHCDKARSEIINQYGLETRVSKKMWTIPHGHLLDEFPNKYSRNTARAEMGIPEEESLFLYFGGITPRKGVPDLIRAFRSIPQDGPRLLIAGSATDEVQTQLESLADDDSRIIFDFRHIPEETVDMYMKAADAAVLPFRSAMTSATLITAMGYSLPVIIPEMGCLPETVVRDDAFIYDHTHENGLSDALLRATDADLRAMGENNLQKIQSFDWESIGKRTSHVYRTILSV